MSEGFTLDTSGLEKSLDDLEKEFKIKMLMYGDTAAQTLAGYARENRPWTDRTGHARERLVGTAEATDTGVRVVLAHTVDYGLWLELAHEKNYAIVEPTIRLKTPEVWQGMQDLFNGMKL